MFDNDLDEDKYSPEAVRSVARQAKSVIIGGGLAFLFSGFGLLYTNSVLGVLCLIVEPFIVTAALIDLRAGVELNVGIMYIIVFHVFTAILAIIGVGFHNTRLLRSLL